MVLQLIKATASGLTTTGRTIQNGVGTVKGAVDVASNKPKRNELIGKIKVLKNGGKDAQREVIEQFKERFSGLAPKDMRDKLGDVEVDANKLNHAGDEPGKQHIKGVHPTLQQATNPIEELAKKVKALPMPQRNISILLLVILFILAAITITTGGVSRLQLFWNSILGKTVLNTGFVETDTDPKTGKVTGETVFIGGNGAGSVNELPEGVRDKTQDILNQIAGSHPLGVN